MLVNLKKLNKLPAKTFKYLEMNELNLEDFDFDIQKKYTHNVIDDVKNSIVTISSKEYIDIQNAQKIDNLKDDINYGVSESLVNLANNRYNSIHNINIEKESEVQKPIVLNYALDTQNPLLIDKNVIVAESSSVSTVIIRYFANDSANDSNKSNLLHNGLTKVYANQNSIIHLIIVQDLNENAKHFNSLVSYVGKNAKVFVTMVEIGSNTSVTNYTGSLLFDKAQTNVNTIYFGTQDMKIDINYNIIHKALDTKSNIKVKGVLDDNVQKKFKGTIDFRKGAKGSVGAESEDVILMSPTVKCDSTPILLCTEEDVSGSHAASIGKIDKAKLFYIMSRGFSQKDAKKLIVEAMFNDIIDSINDSAIKEKIQNDIKRRLK